MKRTLFNITLTLSLLLMISSLNAFAQGKFIYTNNDRISNNTVSGFKVAANGKLELLPGFPAGTDGGGGTPAEGSTNGNKIVATEKGPFLFLVSEGDQEIASYHIDPASGALTFITTKNFGGGGDDRPMLLAASGDEKFLFLHNKNDQTLHSLAINNDGTLTDIQTIQLPEGSNVSELKVSPNNKFLAITNSRVYEENNIIKRDLRIEMYSIAGNGVLSDVPGSPFHGSSGTNPDDAVFNCDGSLLFVAKASPGTEHTVIDVFTVAANGDLSSVQGSPFSFPALGPVNNLIMSPNGKYLFACVRLLNENGRYAIGVITVGPGGQLELPLFSTYYVGSNIDNDNVTNLAIDAKGEYLYVSYLMQAVEVLKIGADGAISIIPDNVVATGEEFGDFQKAQLTSLAAFPLPKKCQIKAPADITVDNAPGVCGANVKYANATTCGTDCGTVTCQPASGSFFDVGVHTVTCSSTKADDATFKITVKDVSAPTIFQQPDIMVSTDPNKCSAVVNFTVSASDNCGSANTQADFTSGATFPKGVTTVHITSTDNAGNVANYSFKITVSDAQAPSINCQADIMINNELNKCGAVANYALPTVSDNCPNVGVPVCNPPSGTFFPIGQTMVNCSVKDASDNSSQCSFKVTVKDTQIPTINCPGNKIAATLTPCDTGIVVTYPAPTVGDNCPNNLNVICSPASGTVFPVGNTMVTCTVTDGGGNQAQCSFKVTIFNIWLQDESNPANVLMFNSLTGEYRLCVAGMNQPVTGTGTVMKQGCSASLQHNTADRRVMASADAGGNKGNATYQSPPGTLKATILDKNILNNTTICQ